MESFDVTDWFDGLTQLVWNPGQAGTKNILASKYYHLMENPQIKSSLVGTSGKKVIVVVNQIKLRFD